MPVTLNSVLQVLIFLAIVLLITKPMGLYMTAIFSGRRTWLTPVFAPVERLFYRLCGDQSGGGAEVVGVRHRHAGLQRGRHAAPVSARAHPAVAAGFLQPAGSCAMSSQGSRSIPPPASRPIPTGRTTAASRP